MSDSFVVVKGKDGALHITIQSGKTRPPTTCTLRAADVSAVLPVRLRPLSVFSPTSVALVTADRVEIRALQPDGQGVQAAVLELPPTQPQEQPVVSVVQTAAHYVALLGPTTHDVEAVMGWALTGGPALFCQSLVAVVPSTLARCPEMLRQRVTMPMGALEVCAVQSEGPTALQCALKVAVCLDEHQGLPWLGCAQLVATVGCSAAGGADVELRHLGLLDERQGQLDAFAFSNSVGAWRGVFSDPTPLLVRVYEAGAPLRIRVWTPVLCGPLEWRGRARELQQLVSFLCGRVRSAALVRTILEWGCCSSSGSGSARRRQALTVVPFMALGLVRTGRTVQDLQQLGRALAQADDERAMLTGGADRRLLRDVIEGLQVNRRSSVAAEQQGAYADGVVPARAMALAPSQVPSPAEGVELAWAQPIDAEVRAVQEALAMGAGPALRIFWRSLVDGADVDEPLLRFCHHLLVEYPHLPAQQPRTAQALYALMTCWALTAEQARRSAAMGPARPVRQLAGQVARLLCPLAGQVVAAQVATAARLPAALDVSLHAFRFLLAAARDAYLHDECGAAIGAALLALVQAALAGGRIVHRPARTAVAAAAAEAPLENVTAGMALRVATTFPVPRDPTNQPVEVVLAAATAPVAATFQAVVTDFFQCLTRLELAQQVAQVAAARQRGQAQAAGVMALSDLPELQRRLAQMQPSAAVGDLEVGFEALLAVSRLLQLSTMNDVIEEKLLTEDVFAGVVNALHHAAVYLPTTYLPTKSAVSIPTSELLHNGAAAALEYFRVFLERSGDKVFQQLAQRHMLLEVVATRMAIDIIATDDDLSLSDASGGPPFLALLMRRSGGLRDAVEMLSQQCGLGGAAGQPGLSRYAAMGVLVICTHWVRGTRGQDERSRAHAALFKVVRRLLDLSWDDGAVANAAMALLEAMTFGPERSAARAEQVLMRGGTDLLLDAVERSFLVPTQKFSSLHLFMWEALQLSCDVGVAMTANLLRGISSRLQLDRPESTALLTGVSSSEVLDVMFTRLRTPDVQAGTVQLLVRFWAIVIKGHQDRDLPVPAECLLRANLALLAEIVKQHKQIWFELDSDVKFIQHTAALLN